MTDRLKTEALPHLYSMDIQFERELTHTEVCNFKLIVQKFIDEMYSVGDLPYGENGHLVDRENCLYEHWDSIGDYSND